MIRHLVQSTQSLQRYVCIVVYEYGESVAGGCDDRSLLVG
jgi:hypothetical protein